MPTGIMELQGQCLLAPLTTLGLGGRAEYFIDVSTIEELRGTSTKKLGSSEAFSRPILGGGSNALIPDDGVERNRLSLWRQPPASANEAPKVMQSSVDVERRRYEWDALVAWAVNEGLWGLECLGGIPGWVGSRTYSKTLAPYSVENWRMFSIRSKSSICPMASVQRLKRARNLGWDIETVI